MDKHAIIIGIGPGMGFSLAKKFGLENFRISLFGRNTAKLTEYKKTLEAEGIKSEHYLADASRFENLAQAITTSIMHHGNPDVLIYNAVQAGTSHALEHPAREYTEDFKANVVGAIQAAQTVCPYMEKGGGGTILLTGGGFAEFPNPHYASISIGKAGLRSAAHLLHLAMSSKAIKVGTVTIYGTIAKGTHFDPDIIADHYWDMHQTPLDEDWQVERKFD